jgi:hypothetical protein
LLKGSNSFIGLLLFPPPVNTSENTLIGPICVATTGIIRLESPRLNPKVNNRIRIITIVIFNGIVININPMVDVSYLILQVIVTFSICHGYNDVDEQHSSIIAYKDTI